ncbi:MAG: hypothetical protein QXI89_01890 [Candidatus Anstonellales archaeon]
MAKRFAINKDYKYIKNFKIAQRSFIDNLLDQFKTKKPKQEKVKEIKEKVQVKGIDIMLMKALPLLIFLGLIGYFYITFQNITASLAEQPVIGEEKIKFPEIRKALFIDYGARDNRIYAALINLYLPEEKIYTIHLSRMIRPFTGNIFIYSDDIYPKTEDTLKFIETLEKELNNKGFVVQRIYSKEQLNYIDSNSIFVLPSDKLPANIENYFDKMSEKGITILIISSTPTNEQIELGIRDITSYWASKDIRFIPSTFKPSGMKMYQAFYYVDKASLINGGASYILTKGGDEFIFIPGSVGDTITNHWRNSQEAALDTANIIIEFVKGLREYKKEEGERLVPDEILYNLPNGSHYVLIENNDKNKSALNVLLTADLDGNTFFYKPLTVVKDYNGYIYPNEPMPILPFYVRNVPIVFEYLPDPEQALFSSIGLKLVNANNQVVDNVTLAQGSQVPLNSISTVQYINKDLNDTRYLIELVDLRKNTVYSRSVLELGTLEIRPEPKFDEGKITFYFEIAGRPTKVGNVVLSLVGGDFTAGTRNSDRITIDMSGYYGGAIPAGNYTFKFSIEGLGQREVNIYNPPKIGISRLFSIERMALILIAGIIYAVGMMVKRAEELPYNIDIPDFAPVEYTTLELSKEEIKKAFEVISDYYKWKYIPLRLEEIKRGISMMLGRKDLVINDFNLEIVLGNLERDGIVKEESGFYVLTEWLKSGFTIQQLIAFRLIRDAAIAHALPFKNITRALPHTKVTFPWQEMWIYLYSSLDKERITDAILNNVGKTEALQIILVPDEREAYTFHTLLSSGRKKDSLIKAYIDNGIIFLFTTQELIDKIEQLSLS